MWKSRGRGIQMNNFRCLHNPMNKLIMKIMEYFTLPGTWRITNNWYSLHPLELDSTPNPRDMMGSIPSRGAKRLQEFFSVFPHFCQRIQCSVVRSNNANRAKRSNCASLDCAWLHRAAPRGATGNASFRGRHGENLSYKWDPRPSCSFISPCRDVVTNCSKTR